MQIELMTIERPKFENVKLTDGLRWKGGGGWRYEEKMDGVWAVKSFFDGSIIAGEQMKDGRFFAFDLLFLAGFDYRFMPLSKRLQALDDLQKDALVCHLTIQRPETGSGGEFLEYVLSNGGEGVVAKRLDAPYGEPWFKCKRVETFDLLVTDKVCPSIRLATIEGEDRGWCCARAAFDDVRIGQIVEVAAFSLTSKGKLREPRFIRIRHDKTV